jgi:hypothetical protein
MSTKEQRRRAVSLKKREAKQKRRLANSPRPIYSVGNRIQINNDVMDVQWTDLPIGGWVGEIIKVHREKDEPKYDIRWTEETLAKCHPIYGLLAHDESEQIEEYCLIPEEQIHAFAGGEVVLVPPGDISHYTDRPLDPNNSIDRIRMIFGTKPLEWFPMLEDENSPEEKDRLLKRYYDHLSEHLVCPFEAMYIARRGLHIDTEHAFTVKALMVPDVFKEKKPDEPGLYCTGLDPAGNLLEVPLKYIFCEDMPQRQLLEDYRLWLGLVPSSLIDMFAAFAEASGLDIDAIRQSIEKSGAGQSRGV